MSKVGTKLALALVALGLWAAPALAAPPKPPAPDMPPHIEAALDLSDSQYNRIETIRQRYAQQEFYRRQRLERERNRERRQMQKEIEQVLTPEQRAKWEEMRSQAPAWTPGPDRRPGRDYRHRGPHRRGWECGSGCASACREVCGPNCDGACPSECPGRCATKAAPAAKP